MKNLLVYIVLIFPGINLFAQSETPASMNIVRRFEENYNLGLYDSIFTMFSPEMQNSLPIDKTVKFFTGLKSQAGQIQNHEFIRYENETSASYKTTFERALFSVNISINKQSKINGLYVKPYIESNAPKMERNVTKLKLPFHDEWTVVWGGDTRELNYHVDHAAQKNAFDMVIMNAQGKSFKTDGKVNEDYYAFGKELLAPCDGEVVLVVDGIKDNKPGELNPVYIPGNTVIIKTAKLEYLFFAHFKQHSIKVTQGQSVKQGQLLGLCGNSGNSSEPHLHFHIQNIENMNNATGVKCYFDTIIVNDQARSDYSPVKKDTIRNK
ncbi:MAG TPA: DUF3887 domain-containing protein [Ohtaekwangia sp.]